MAKREVKIYMNRYALEAAQDKKQAVERYEQEKILRSTLGAQTILTQDQINNYLNSSAESIAPLEYKRIRDTISYRGMSVVLNQKTIEGSFSDLPERPEAIEGFGELSEKNFFSAIRNPKVTSSAINASGEITLQYEAQEGFKIFQTSRELEAALKRINDVDSTGKKTGTGKVTAFDLETSGGITRGPELRAQGHIHDFTFITQDVDSIDTRAVDEDYPRNAPPDVIKQHKEKQAVEAQELQKHDQELRRQGKKQVYTSILGSTADENTEYEKIIEKYRKGNALTKEEHVTAERLMLVGNEATTFADNPDEQAKGLFRYKTFAGQQDIANRTVEDMERGAKRLRDIGIIQEEMRARTQPGSVKDMSVLTSVSAIDSGAVDSVKNLKVTATEAELLKGLRDVLVGGSDRKGITLLGQNIRSFDISRLNQLIRDPKLSENARQYIQSIIAEHRGLRAEFEQGIEQGKKLPELGLQLNYVLDTQPIVRQQLQDNGFYTDIDLRENSKLGLSKGQQEAVVRTLGRHHKTDFYAGRPAHMSTTDVEALLWMSKKIGLLDDQSVINAEFVKPDRVPGFSNDSAKPAKVFDDIAGTLKYNIDNQVANAAQNTIDIAANDGKLFLATKYANPSAYNNVLLFMEDAFTREIRTNEGYRFFEGKKQVVHDTFGQFGFQAGISYQIQNIRQFAVADEYSAAMKKINPMLDINEAVAITFTPDTGSDVTPYRSHAPITIVGMKQDVQNIVNDVLKLYGTKQADDTITDENVSEQVKRDLGITKVEKAADGSVSITRTEYDPNTIYQRSQRVAHEESAAREARDHNYKKDKRLLDFIDVKEEAVTKLQQSSGYTREEAEKVFMENIRNATRQVIDKLKNEEEVVEGDVKGTFFDYFGFKPDKQQAKTGLYSETLSKHLVRLGYVEQNKDLFAHAIKLAEKQGGEWSEHAIATYKKLWEGFDDAIMRIEGDQPESLGMRNTGQYNYQIANRFDINLKGFGNIREDKIISVDLSAQNASLVDKVLRQLGYDTGEIRKISDESKAKILHELNEHLIRTKQIGVRSHTVYGSHTQILEGAISKITEQLDSTRQTPNVVSTTRPTPIRRRNVAMSELQSTEEVNASTKRFLENKYGYTLGGNAHYNVVNQAANAIDVDVLQSRLEGSFAGIGNSRYDALHDLFTKIHYVSVGSGRFYDTTVDPFMANVFAVDLEGFEFSGKFTDVKDPKQAQVHDLSVRVPKLEHGFHIYPLSDKSGRELPVMLTKRLNREDYFQDKGLGTSIRNVNMDEVRRFNFYQDLLDHLKNTGQVSADYLPTIDPYVIFDKNVAADIEKELHKGLQGAYKEQTLKNLAYELFSSIASQQGPTKQIASDIRGFVQSYFTKDEAAELLKSFDTALKSVREITFDAVNTKESDLAAVEDIVTDYLKDTGADAVVVTHDQKHPVTSLSENIHMAVGDLISGNIDQDRYQQLQEDLRTTEIGTRVADLIDDMSMLSAQDFQDYGTTENIANEVAESVDEMIRTSEKDYYAGAAETRPVRLGGHDFFVDTRRPDAETADALLTQYLGGVQQRYIAEQSGNLDYKRSNLLTKFEKSGHGKYNTLEEAVAGLRHEQEAKVSTDIVRNSVNEIFLSNVYSTDPDQLDKAIRRTSRTQAEIEDIRVALDNLIQRNDALQDTGQVTIRIHGQDMSFAPNDFENVFQTQQMSVQELQDLEERLYKSGQIDTGRAYRFKNDTIDDVLFRIREGLEARSRNAIYDFGLTDTDPLFRITNHINRNMYGYDRTTRISVLRSLSEVLQNIQLPAQSAGYTAYSDPELFKAGTATVTQVIIDNMRQTREVDADKGRLTSTARYTIGGIAEHMGAGSLQEGIDILDKVAFDLPIIQVASKDYQENKDAAKKWANEVVDTILNVHVSDQEISKYGWSADQTKVIQKIQEIKRRDMKAALTNIFGSIVNNGMDLGWNKDTGQVFARAGGEGGTWQELILPKEVWSDGAFQSRLGYHRISTPLEIAAISDRPGDIPEFRFMSQAGRILQEKTKYLGSRLREQMTPEDMMKELQYILGSANKEIRRAPSSLNVRTQTRFNQALFSYEAVIDNLDLLDIKDEDLFARKIDSATAPGGIIDPKTGKYVLDYEDANAKILRKFQENLRFRRQNPELPDSKLPHPDIAWNPERPEMGLINALQAKREAIVRAVSTKLGNREWSELEPFLDWNIKKSGHLMGSFLTFGDFLEQFNQQKRRAQESINEAPHFNVQRAVEHIKYNETESVRIGRAITNDVMLNYTTQQLGVAAGTVDTTIQAKTISMRSHDLSLVVNEGMRQMEDLARKAIDTYDVQWMSQNGLRYEELGIIGKNAAGEYEFKGIADPIRRFLSLMNTTEQGAYMTQEMFDYAFNYRQSMQRIDIEKVVEDPQTIRDIIQENIGLRHTMSFDNQGNVSFKYGQGRFIEKGDIIVRLKGMSAGETVPKKANYSGLLNFGFFHNDGTLVTEETIEARLNSAEAKAKLSKATNEVEKRAIAINMLANDYRAMFYVEDMNANPAAKMADYAEKQMTTAIITDTGSIDKRIGQVMADLGFRFERSYVSMLDIKTIESLQGATDISQTRFGILANGLRESQRRYEEGLRAVNPNYVGSSSGQLAQLTSQEFMDVLNARGFNNADDFYNALMKERHQATDVLYEVLRTMKILDPGEMFQGITEQGSTLAKHGDVTDARKIADQLLARGKSIDDVAKLFSQHLIPEGQIEKTDWNQILRRGADQLIVNKALAINISEDVAERIFKDAGIPDWSPVQHLRINLPQHNVEGLTGNVIDSQGNAQQEIVYTKSFDEVSQVGGHHDLQTLDRVKWDNRVVSINENIRADKSMKEEALAYLTKYDPNHPERGEALYNRYIAPLKEGDVVLPGLTEQINRASLHRQGSENSLILMDWAKNAAGEDIIEINQQAVDELVQRKGLNKDVTIALLESFRDGSLHATTVSEEGFMAQYTAWASREANAFNYGERSVEEMKKLGFEVKTLDEILADSRSAGFENSIFGKNILLDIGSGSRYGTAGTFQAKGAQPNFLAISMNPVDLDINPDAMFDEHIASGPQKKVDTLLSALEDYHAAIRGENAEGRPLSQDERTQAASQLSRKIEDINDATWQSWVSKKGQLANSARGHMYDSARFTSHGFDFTGLEDLGKENLADKLREIQADTTLTDVEKVTQTDYWNKMFQAAGKLRSKGGSGYALSDLTLSGINLVENAAHANPINFNVQIQSLERMHEVYGRQIDNLFSSQLGLGDSVRNEIREALYSKVQTQGVSGYVLRHPTQYEGSIQAAQIYFSDAVTGNNALSMTTRIGMRKEDFDADAVESSLHKERARITVGGKTINADIDSAMFETLKSMGSNHGITVELLGNGQRNFDNLMAQQFLIGASTSSRYKYVQDWMNTYDALLMDFQKSTKKNSNVMTTQFDGNSVSGAKMNTKIAIGNITGYTEQERRQLENQYYRFMSDIYHGNQGVQFAQLKDVQEQRNFAFDVIRADYTNATTGEVDLQGVMNDTRFRALHFVTKTEQIGSDLVSQTGKIGAGSVNYNTQQYMRILQDAFANGIKDGVVTADNMDGTMRRAQVINTALIEGNLTPKNVAGQAITEEAKILKNQEMGKVFQEAFEAARTGMNRQEAEEKLYNFLTTNYLGTKPQPGQPDTDLGRRDNELARLFTDLEKADGIKRTATYEEGEKLMREYAHNVVFLDWSENARALRVMRQGTTNAEFVPERQVGAASPLGNIPGSSLNIQQHNTAFVNATEKVLDRKVSAQFSSPTFSKNQMDLAELTAQAANNLRQYGQSLSDAANISQVGRSAGLMDSLLQGSGSMIKGFHGGGALFAGVVGGLMVAGFANDPTGGTMKKRRKQQEQAGGPAPVWGNGRRPPSAGQNINGMADGMSLQQQRDPMPLSDTNLNVLRGMPQQSYVVNINGSSPQGQRAALDAINNAGHAAMPQQTNINMNVSTTYSDKMSQYQVDRMVQSALGF